MVSLSRSRSEQNMAVISLKTFSLEKIVQKKLDYVLSQSSEKENLLSQFYYPVEKALIQAVLELHKGNQMQAARHLGWNRNTLKKKMSAYNIHLKSLMLSLKDTSFVGKELFVCFIEDLDLMEAARRKFLFLKEKSQFLESPFLIQKYLQPIEKAIIKTVFKHFKGHRIKTAKALDINRNTLKSKLDFYKLLS